MTSGSGIIVGRNRFYTKTALTDYTKRQHGEYGAYVAAGGDTLRQGRGGHLARDASVESNEIGNGGTGH